MLAQLSPFVAIRREDGAVISDDVIGAFSFFRRLRGLIGQRRLSDRGALWLKPGGSIHTFGMRFAIDTVFLDSNQKVLAISSEVHPCQWRWAPQGTHSTLELVAGRNVQIGLKPGDELLIHHAQEG